MTSRNGKLWPPPETDEARLLHCLQDSADYLPPGAQVVGQHLVREVERLVTWRHQNRRRSGRAAPSPGVGAPHHGVDTVAMLE